MRMESALTAVFEILSFGAIIVLVVLGLGIIASMMGIFNFAHGEFVLLGAYTTYLFYASGLPVWLGMVAAPIVARRVVGFVLERLVIRRFYAAPIVAMLGTYALGLIIRETVRGADRRALPCRAGAASSAPSSSAACSFRKWRVAIIVITALVMIGSYLLLTRTALRPAGPGVAGESVAGARLRDLDQHDLRRHLCVRRGAGGACRRAGRAGLLALRRSRHSLSDPGLSRGDAGRRRHLRGAGRSAPVSSASLSAALPWVVAPVLADVLVFVIAIVIVKFWPGGLIAAGRRV